MAAHETTVLTLSNFALFSSLIWDGLRGPKSFSQISKKSGGQGQWSLSPFLSTNILPDHAGQPALAQSLEPAIIHASEVEPAYSFGLVKTWVEHQLCPRRLWLLLLSQGSCNKEIFSGPRPERESGRSFYLVHCFSFSYPEQSRACLSHAGSKMQRRKQRFGIRYLFCFLFSDVFTLRESLHLSEPQFYLWHTNNLTNLTKLLRRVKEIYK